MHIVFRADWGAKAPTEPLRSITLPTPRLWVHHTADNAKGAAGVRAIQAYHQNVKGWIDIAYSFLVDSDGTIYEGRGVGKAGAHTEGDNSRSHAICLMGDFTSKTPTAKAIDALVDLARHGRELGWWVPTLGGHRDAPGAQTQCPGDKLYAMLPQVRARAQMSEDDDMTPSELAEAYRTQPLRGVVKDLTLGAVLDGLREPDAAHKDRGELRGPLKALIREVLEGLVVVREVPVDGG